MMVGTERVDIRKGGLFQGEVEEVKAMSSAVAAGIVAAASLVFPGVAPAYGADASTYEALDLGTLVGSSSHSGTSGAYAYHVLNDQGQVVGWSYGADGQQHAFSWTAAAGMTDLGPGMAKAVANTGEVVGQSAAGHAFSWSATGGLVDLGTIGGRWSNAVAVNNYGEVVGDVETPAWTAGHAFSWTPSSGMVDLGTLGGAESYAVAVNDAGQIAGYSRTGAGWRHAFIWEPQTGMVDLGALAGSISQAYAINDLGAVVGDSYVDYSHRHAFYWSGATGLIDLGTLGGATSTAQDINDNGDVVGYSQTATGSWHPFVWSLAGGMIDLGTVGGADAYAWAINNTGAVAGYGSTASGTRHAFVWTSDAGMTDLGTLGGSESFGVAINTRGEVAGWSNTAAGWSHATLWRLVSTGVTPPDPPSTPDLDDQSDSGVSNTDNVTNQTSLTFVGTAEASTTITLYRDGTSVGSATAEPATGAWSITDPTAPDGVHAYTATATDASGNVSGSSGSLTVTVDTVYPWALLPESPLSTDATGPSGATVSYTVTGGDNSGLPVSIDCAPASNSTFAIGDTTVSCTISDAAGNNAAASFVAHVRGAAEQLARLQTLVTGVGPGTSLSDKLVAAVAAVNAGDVPTAVAIVQAFEQEVAAQTDKSIPPSTAATLLEAARRIEAVLA